jgi:hypothetical protein
MTLSIMDRATIQAMIDDAVLARRQPYPDIAIMKSRYIGCIPVLETGFEIYGALGDIYRYATFASVINSANPFPTTEIVDNLEYRLLVSVSVVQAALPLELDLYDNTNSAVVTDTHVDITGATATDMLYDLTVPITLSAGTCDYKLRYKCVGDSSGVRYKINRFDILVYQVD